MRTEKTRQAYSSETFPCVDALMLSKTPGELYLFHITRAKQHPVPYSPLYDILANITVLNTARSAYLIFVLPEVRKHRASWQHAQTLSIETDPRKQGGEVTDLGVELFQYVMFLSEDDAREYKEFLLEELVPPDRENQCNPFQLVSLQTSSLTIYRFPRRIGLVQS